MNLYESLSDRLKNESFLSFTTMSNNTAVNEDNLKPSLLEKTALYSMIGAIATWAAYTFDSSYSLASIINGTPELEVKGFEQASAFFNSLLATTVTASITNDIRSQGFRESIAARYVLHPITTATVVGSTILGARMLDEYFQITSSHDSNILPYNFGIMAGVFVSAMYKRINIDENNNSKQTKKETSLENRA